jgi:hypothetical protein
MNTYSDLRDINTQLDIRLIIAPVGEPDFRVAVNNNISEYTQLSGPIILDYRVDLLDSIFVDIDLYNKHYTTEYETAIIIRLSIDNTEIIPKYDYLSEYENDHNNNSPTSYVGFNGKWTLTIDEPFYHWLHRISGQGWLLQ